jgi:L-threonylcarbamoyladenylate synthase
VIEMAQETFGVVRKSPSAIETAVEALKNSGVIVCPTDTMYGFSGDATKEDVVVKIQTIKKRSEEKPFLVLVSDIEMLEKYAHVTQLARLLLKKFQYSSLTILLRAKDNQLQSVQSEDGYVGFRIPNDLFCVELVKSFKKPLISTSANVSGTMCISNIGRIIETWKGSGVSLFIYGDEGQEQLPSTIVDVRGGKVTLVREGVVAIDLLKPYM